ncbi:uncharacterized protein LOC119323136 [Triticum dicoccoides]|uniref:uncharacterized protein LOC119323136 n=1 Tax=Triticum dicoccoides TaxID=85692 RepID=UPI0018911787|nr:uncharacterized protein LOC119323136 [Triticum dicoccoides]
MPSCRSEPPSPFHFVHVSICWAQALGILCHLIISEGSISLDRNWNANSSNSWRIATAPKKQEFQLYKEIHVCVTEPLHEVSRWSFVLRQEGNSIDMAIESLLNAEKQCCLAGDVASTRKDIVELSFKDGAWKMLNYQIVLLSKRRRGQLKISQR